MTPDLEKLEALAKAAIDQLRSHQTQLDMDGVIVGVSRQAIYEVLTFTDTLIERVRELEEFVGRRVPTDEFLEERKMWPDHETSEVELDMSDLRTARRIMKGTT